MLNNWVLSMVFISLLSSFSATAIFNNDLSSFFATPISNTESLHRDFYRQSCPQVEGVIRMSMARFFFQNHQFPAGLIRLYFHDCFPQGCDASLLLDASVGGSEKQADPNLTVKGFDEIDQIKAAVENLCPRVVSCADILTIATRDAIVLSGGPFYPVSTGRRDSTKAFAKEAVDQLPGPNDSIDRILKLFAAKGLDERDMVSLLGAHNVGKIDCGFFSNRLFNFSGTGKPDPTIDPSYLEVMRSRCKDGADIKSNQASLWGLAYSKHLFSALALKGAFSTQYYQSLLKGRGLMFSDQQLMFNEKTAQLVRTYASDFGFMFRADFSKAMQKLSEFNVLTGSQGVIREKCRV